ncbi:extracellular solute-binding protein [Roseospira marina]|nr:extracellular solute-binding protein [Roseospira marina]MBB4313124.1 multiple sugar transport system substrate-binding protein [Roseospira marina]MBB5086135.1 multiple sugar transport system substrate-binding protein [Roseospira marina]
MTTGQRHGRAAALGFAVLIAASLLARDAASTDRMAGTKPAENVQGTVLRVGVQAAPAISLPAETHGRTWTHAHGGRVEVVRIPFEHLYDRLMAGLTGTDAPFDVIFHAPGWAADFAPYLREMPARIAEDESFDDIHPVFRDRLMRWDGRWVSVTVDGDVFSGYYRRDLFEDPINRRAFARRYGRPLMPPTTWAQYRTIAAFFTGRTGPDGQPVYGTSEPFARGGQEVWTVFARAAAYTNPPGVAGAQFFDPDTMTPRINTPGWVRAVREYRDIAAFSPPDALRNGITESRRAFLDGHTAMALDWGDTGTMAENPKHSRVAGCVGYFVLPGSDEVWNADTDAWQPIPNGRRVPFLAFGGWVAAVPRNAPNPDAAWDYILWFSNVRNSMADVLDGRTGVNPYRYSHFVEVDAWMRVLPPRAAADYIRVIRSSLDSPHAALDLRLPGFQAYMDSFETELTRILAGEVPVQEGLDAAAARWEAITDRHGRAAQRAHYRASMGLAPAAP